MKLIGISGKLKHGKTETAKILSSCLPHTQIISFADALKEEVAIACKVTPDFINRNKDCFRKILQGWGTDFKRKANPDYWVQAWVKRVLKSDAEYIIADDVRFLNEAECIKSAGGILIRVKRPSQVSDESHVSECELDDFVFDYNVLNESDVDHLKLTIKQLMQQIK